jgi:hypothetical protein
VTRKYTPITDVLTKSHVDFCIKVYPKSSKHPQGGLMSQYLAKLPQGDYIKMKAGPDRIRYNGFGYFDIARCSP